MRIRKSIIQGGIMKLGYEPNHFTNIHGIDHQICRQFESLYHKTANETERDNLILAFIRRYARSHFDDFMTAVQKNKTLASYTQHPALREFWQTLTQEVEDIENDATVNM